MEIQNNLSVYQHFKSIWKEIDNNNLIKLSQVYIYIYK